MTADNAFGLVVMAAIAGVLGVFAWMANLTSHLALTAMIQWENVGMEFCRRPCLSGVAVLAFETEKTSMDFRFPMTLAAFGWDAGKFLRCMALQAIQFGMFAIQWKVIGVIK